MKICNNCGTEYEDNQTVCAKCGAGLSDKVASKPEQENAHSVTAAPQENHVSQQNAPYQPQMYIPYPTDTRRSTAPIVLGIVSLFIAIISLLTLDHLMFDYSDNIYYILCPVFTVMCCSIIGLILANRDIKDNIRWSGKGAVALNLISLFFALIVIARLIVNYFLEIYWY